MKIERQCPFCEDLKFSIEVWGDIFLLKCLRNSSQAYWVQMKRDGKFTPVETYIPNPRTRMSARDQSNFNKLQIPYWKLMGQKAKAKDVAYEKALKWRGMTYGDAVMERSQQGEYQSALPQWEESLNKKTYEPKYQKS